MKKVLHIVFALMIVLCVYSCREKGRVIPRDDMAELYVRMMLIDQWLTNHPDVYKIADTSLVYEPILNEYGYTGKDYLASVDYYLRDPDKFAKVFGDVKKVLQKRIDELTVEERRAARLDSIRKAIEAKPFKRAEIYLFAEPDSTRKDTVSIMADSAGCLVWSRIYPDTMYYGPVYRVKQKDTVSVAVKDSVDMSAVKCKDFTPAMKDSSGLPDIVNIAKAHLADELSATEAEVSELPQAKLR